MKTIVNVPTKQSLIRETRDYLMIALGLISLWYRLDSISVAQ